MADIKEELKQDTSNKRRFLYKAGVYASIALATLGMPNLANYLKKDNKENPKAKVENVTGYTRVVDFQVDTLQQSESAAAYYSPANNSITENYVEGEDNSFNQSLATVAHEAKHRDNHLSGLDNLPMSLEQYYKTRCHNEISANIVELLQIRQQWLVAKSDSERSEIEKINPRFSFYFEALKEGKITNKHSNVKEFDEEMKFIAQGVQNMWMSTLDYLCDKNHCEQTKNFLSRHDYDELAPNEANYRAYVDYVYKIGGIDFGVYLEDIKCNNNNIRIADEKIQNAEHRDDVKEMLVPFAESLVRNFENQEYPPMLAPMSLEQMTKLMYDKEKANFIQEIVDVRNMWLEAKTDADRDNIVVDYMGQDARDYYMALKEGKIKPEGKRLNADEIEFVNNIEVLGGEYEATALAFFKLYKDMAVEDNDNYYEERANFLTFDGIDYSKDIKEPNVQAYNPLVVLADKMIENGESKASVKELLRTKVDLDSDILYVKEDSNPRLSPLQQHNIERHRMFVQNVMFRCYMGNDDKFAENFVNNAEYFLSELESNDLLKLNWDVQEYNIAEDIAKENGSSLYVSGGNDELYKKELAKVYTFNGRNLLENFSGDVEKLIPMNISEYPVENVSDMSFMERYENFKEKIAEKVANMINPLYTKKTDTSSDYYGEPQYFEWSEDNRVSEVQQTEIYDFRSNILKDQRSYLEIKDACVASKMSEAKFDSKVNQNALEEEHVNDSSQTQSANKTFVVTPDMLER